MSKAGAHLKQEKSLSGSPQSGEPVYLTIGKIRRPHGVKGEVVMEMVTDFPQKIKAGIQIYIGEKKQEHKLASIRPNGDLFLISIEGFTDCDAVSVFRNQWVYAQSSTVGPLPDGLFYHREVIGMKVIDEQGNFLGVVKEILVTGANDVYVVDTQDNHEILLPAIKSVILSMNRDTHSMVVRLQEWD
ncbi:MAG: 16S rRNA processing protein RimM [Anaerolineaceae bacterium]|nr:16S rRNA processing protein RimM [Anaerolineaceae bacterium]